MNWEAIGAVGEIVGALAVVVSVLYLASQIRASRRSDQLNSTANVGNSIADWMGLIASNRELFELFRNGMRNYEALERAEKARFKFLMIQYFRAQEATWMHFRRGAVDESYWSALQQNNRKFLRNSGARKALEQNADVFDSRFVADLRASMDSDGG